MDIFDCSTNYCGGREAAPCNPCCKERKALPECVSPAMAYVPFQQWMEVYSADKGLSAGTMFPCLNLPFGGCAK